MAVELLAQRDRAAAVAVDPAHAGLLAARRRRPRRHCLRRSRGAPALGGQPLSGSWEQEPQTVALLGGEGVLLPGATGDDAPVEVQAPSRRLPRALLTDFPDPPVLRLA